jgi:hypothetical protein
VGNQTFEVDQRNVGGTYPNIPNGTLIQDRWAIGKAGTLAVSAGQNSVSTGINLPGTSFAISRSFLRITLTTAQATLAAGDHLWIQQAVEGIRWRELQSDVHSLQVLVRSSVAGLAFGASLSDPTGAHSLTNLLTIPSANTWTLLSLPNLPLWPAGGTFVNTPGNAGYYLYVCLAAGTTYISPANGSWQNGNFAGAVGQSNFAASPVNSTLDISYLSHEPGSLCSNPPLDCPFTQNYDDCLRYYCKSYDYETGAGTATFVGDVVWWQGTTTSLRGTIRFPKPMAKIPNVIIYNTSTGAANSIRLLGTDYAVSSVGDIGKGGFDSMTTATLPAVTAGASAFGQYTADSGW